MFTQHERSRTMKANRPQIEDRTVARYSRPAMTLIALAGFRRSCLFDRGADGVLVRAGIDHGRSGGLVAKALADGRQ